MSFLDNLPQGSLDSWFRWLTIFAISFPILGAVIGGICAWGAFTVGNRISYLQAAAVREARELATSRGLHPDAPTTAKMFALAKQLCPKIHKFPVTAANGNQEAQAYAADFVEVFKAAGCNTDLQLPIPGLTPDVEGVKIGVRNYTDISAAAELIAKILSAGEISYEVAPLKGDFFPDEPFVLIIGAKPRQQH
jgi:hypothetical protein